jgi:hypothetical protein
MSPDGDSERQVGEGWVIRRTLSPRSFAAPERARKEYLPLVAAALRKAGVQGRLATPGAFCLRRGPFVVAHAARAPLEIPGKLIDVFEPDLPLLDGARLEPNSSGLYRDVSEILKNSQTPKVLHSTHRLMEERHEGNSTQVVVRGPAETPAVLRLFRETKIPEKLAARTGQQKELEVKWKLSGSTLGVRFPNHPRGVTLEILWK